MSDLRIYLTDGFADDEVVVSVNGRTVFDRDRVATKKLYGLAEELAPVPVAGDSAKLEIKVPKRNLITTFDVDLKKGTHVPVAIDGNRITHSVHKRIGFA